MGEITEIKKSQEIGFNLPDFDPCRSVRQAIHVGMGLRGPETGRHAPIRAGQSSHLWGCLNIWQNIKLKSKHEKIS